MFGTAFPCVIGASIFPELPVQTNSCQWRSNYPPGADMAVAVAIM
jgi:hypothetical protein